MKLIGAVFVMAWFAPQQAAAERGDDDFARYYRLGVLRFDLGDYPGALRAFERGYVARPDKLVFLYNTGLVHRLMGNRAMLLADPTAALSEWSTAIDTWRGLLEKDPKDPRRKKIEDNITATQEDISKVRGRNEDAREEAKKPLTPAPMNQPSAAELQLQAQLNQAADREAEVEDESNRRAGTRLTAAGGALMAAGLVLAYFAVDINGDLAVATAENNTISVGELGDRKVYFASFGAAALSAGVGLLATGISFFAKRVKPRRVRIVPAATGFLLDGPF